ncbi:hypothetical protein B0H14DRAFT_2867940 [Mycena olivaceomarginata]|nr:hypothetical protein B0H14DRAFT_2867940 [Mycena olivaceomarginata]
MPHSKSRHPSCRPSTSTVRQAAFLLTCLTCLSAGSLCILGTRARIIVFQHFARSLLPLASTTTTHRDIKLK